MKISICNNYEADKLKDFNNDKVSHGWAIKEINWKLPEIVKLTTESGISGNEFSDGHRCNSNWIATNSIMLDFDDGGMTQKTLLEKQKHWDFNSYIFSSQNHQKEKNSKKACDRLRVFIPLEESITTELDLEVVKEIILKKFPLADKCCMDKARWFAHGTTEVSSFVGDKKFLNWRELLNSRPAPKPKKGDIGIYTFRLETELKDINKHLIKVKDVTEKTIIYCPICGDAQYRNNDGHNAFIDINEKGLYFIFCSSCKTRGFGVNKSGVYNLYSEHAYWLETKRLQTAVFIDNNTSQHYSLVTKDIDDIKLISFKNQYYAAQYCKSKNLSVPDFYPQVEMTHKFDSDEIINLEKHFVNKYIAPRVLKSKVPEGFEGELPEYIGKLINHVFGDDQQIIDHFMNDLAYLVQTRKKLITSYLMQGTEGTGKGIFFKLVLRKIFGERYCSETDMDAFDSRFNDFLTDNFLVLVSEVSANFTSERRGFSIVEKIKMAITDQFIQIEGKGRSRLNGENNCSFLFATNRRHGIVLSNDDRRFNVAPRQELKIQNTEWWPGYQELVVLIESELQNFVWFLKKQVVNFKLIGVVINNSSKELLQAMSTTDCEDFFEALNKGNGDWFQENLVKKYGYNEEEKFDGIQAILRGLKDEDRVSSTDMCALYNYINNKYLTPKCFSKLANMHLKPPGITQLRKPGSEKKFCGIKVNMKFNDDIF